MPRARVGDIGIHYEAQGDGEPLLLVMGLGSNMAGWMFQILEFSQKYRVVVFDNRGVGWTDAPDIPYSIEMMAGDTVGLMDALDIESAHVLGISMGGFIAQEIALLYPERVKSLIIAASGTHVDPRGAYLLGHWGRLLGIEGGRELYIRETLPWLFTEAMFEKKRIINGIIKMRLSDPRPQPAYAYARQVGACLAFDSRDRIGSISAPALVVVGARDTLFPPSLSKDLAAGMSNADLVVLDRGGHGFPIEIPDDFNGAVLSFLERVRG